VAGDGVEPMAEIAPKTSDCVTLMSDPTGETDIELVIGYHYGLGRSVYAALSYPDETKEDLLARGDKRLFAKAWDKIHTWAAKTDIREGQAFIAPIFRGPHRTNESRKAVTTNDHVENLYGEAAVARINRDWEERRLPQLVEELAQHKAEQALEQEQMAELELLLLDRPMAGDKARQAVLEVIAEGKASVARLQESIAWINDAIRRST